MCLTSAALNQDFILFFVLFFFFFLFYVVFFCVDTSFLAQFSSIRGSKSQIVFCVTPGKKQ